MEDAYEGVNGILYQIRMGNGVYKQAVPEEECHHSSRAVGDEHEDEALDADARTLVQWQMAMMEQNNNR